MTLIFIWYLLTAPYDRLICSMWLSSAPTPALMRQAGCVWSQEQAAGYVWRAVDWSTGRYVCTRPAAELPTVTCDIWPLDRYLIRVYQPNYQEQICTLNVKHAGEPTPQEIAAACPNAHPGYLLKLAASGPEAVEAPPELFCQRPPLSAADWPAVYTDLNTQKDYFLLDYELAWWYGLDYDTAGWQNQWDHYIYDAGVLQAVPPRLIKGVFAQESQFWPLWAPERKKGDEVGLGQLTDAGADTALRYSPGLYNQFCPLAAWDCSVGYDYLPKKSQQMLRDILRSRLRVSGTPRQAAAQAALTIPTWAQVLAAYYCAAGETVKLAGAAPSWEFALAAYHSGMECVRGGEICGDGKRYIEEVRQ